MKPLHFSFLTVFLPTRGIFIPLRGEENGFCIEMRQLRKEMKQETFTDIEYSFRKKKTKREEFPEIMDEIIPWDEWAGVIEPYYF